MGASETAPGAPAARPRARWLLLLALALAFEIGVARNPAVRERVLDSDPPQVEKRLIEPAPPPNVIVFGNSRMFRGVDGRQLADQTGFPRATVLKLAWQRALAREYLYVYRRHRAKLAHARFVIIGIDDWDVAHATWLNPGDVYYATLRERLTGADPRHIPLGLVTWLCSSTYMLRPVLVYAAGAARSAIVGSPPAPTSWASGEPPLLRDDSNPEMEQAWARGELNRDIEDQPAYLRHRARWFGFSAQEVVDQRCGSLPPLSSAGWEWVRQLTAMCVADGATVLIVRPPVRDDYLELMDQRYPAYARAFKTRAAEMVAWAAASESRVHVRIYGSGSELGLPRRAFYDYGHLSPLGRSYFTGELAKWVAQRLREGSG